MQSLGLRCNGHQGSRACNSWRTEFSNREFDQQLTSQGRTPWSESLAGSDARLSIACSGVNEASSELECLLAFKDMAKLIESADSCAAHIFEQLTCNLTLR